MKKTFLILCLGTLVTQATLRITAEAQSQESTPPKYRLFVSFISRHAGPDRPVKEEIDKYISKYQKEKGVELAIEVVHWGREGEIDYCVNLAELSEGDQESFVTEIKSLAKKSERKQVLVEENAPCRNMRHRRP